MSEEELVHNIFNRTSITTTCGLFIEEHMLINTNWVTWNGEHTLKKGKATGYNVSCPYCLLFMGLQHLRSLNKLVDEDTRIANEEAIDFLNKQTVQALVKRSLSAAYPKVFPKEKR